MALEQEIAPKRSPRRDPQDIDIVQATELRNTVRVSRVSKIGDPAPNRPLTSPGVTARASLKALEDALLSSTV